MTRFSERIATAAVEAGDLLHSGVLQQYRAADL